MTDSGMLFCFSLFCNLLSCSPPFPTLPLELEVELHLPSPSDPQTNRVAPVRSASNSCSEALLPPGVRLHYKSLHYWCCFQDVHVKALPDFMTHSRNGMGRLGCLPGRKPIGTGNLLASPFTKVLQRDRAQRERTCRLAAA